MVSSDGRTRGGVVDATNAGVDQWIFVLAIESAAGEHHHPADELATSATAQHHHVQIGTIVDDQDRVRASLSVMPAGTSAQGVAFPETVLLRLITEHGRPSVKISASEEAAGLNGVAGWVSTSDKVALFRFVPAGGGGVLDGAGVGGGDRR